MKGGGMVLGGGWWEGITLTLGLWNGAGDGGAGGGDGAHGWAHTVHRIRPRHGRRVGHPRSRVNGPYRLTCRDTTTKGFTQIHPGQSYGYSQKLKSSISKEGQGTGYKYSLLGKAKQLFGFGSQHFATVRETGLK